MAIAKKTVIPPVPVEPNYAITLTLSKEEALTLKAVMNRIGGDLKTTRRKHTDAISRALYAVVGYCDANDIAPNTGIDFLETK